VNFHSTYAGLAGGWKGFGANPNYKEFKEGRREITTSNTNSNTATITT